MSLEDVGFDSDELVEAVGVSDLVALASDEVVSVLTAEPLSEDEDVEPFA